ncbi:MAG TPA: AMIN domain-containing protein [Longimicrobium sp.]|nr:AMIN domain-containing protein [Longimicrobium sp.]
MKRLLALALLPALLAAAPLPAVAPGDGSVSALRLEGRAGRTELTVEITGGEVSYEHFRLASPARVVVDIRGARSDLPNSRYEGIHRGGVASVRTSQHAADVVRVVVDLERDAEYTVEEVEDGIRISLAGGGAQFAAWRSEGAAPAQVGSRSAARSAGRNSSQSSSEGVFARPNQQQQPQGQRRQQQPSQARRISVTFENTDMRDVLASFAELTRRSIVPGAEVGGIRVDYVSFDDQPWDEALRTLLQAYGLAAEEQPSGIIRVDRIENLAQRERNEPLVTRTFRINYVPVAEMATTLGPLSTERGSVTVNQTTNTLIATDVAGVINDFERLVEQLDVRTPQVTIQAKIIFVNRTDAEELGITYDLKDSRGNSLNQLVSVPDPQDPTTLTNANIVSLGGNSIAALGNATNRVSGPTLQTVMSLVLGRYTLISFLDALQSAELSDVQAAPVVTTSSNHEAQIWVGERTPIRVVDVGGAAGGGGGGGAGGGTAPRASAQLVETGIRLVVTPQVTSDRRILLTLHAERSSATPVATEIGVQFLQQQGDTRVMVRDGETAVIGGLTVTEVTRNRVGIPFLMDLPYLGVLFRRTSDREVKRDLLIMVTPHIVEESAS